MKYLFTFYLAGLLVVICLASLLVLGVFPIVIAYQTHNLNWLLLGLFVTWPLIVGVVIGCTEWLKEE